MAPELMRSIEKNTLFNVIHRSLKMNAAKVRRISIQNDVDGKIDLTGAGSSNH